MLKIQYINCFDDCIVDEVHIAYQTMPLNQVTNELSYADIKYQLGLILVKRNGKQLKAIDQLEKQRILES